MTEIADMGELVRPRQICSKYYAHTKREQAFFAVFIVLSSYPFVSLTTRNITGLLTPRPEPAPLLLALLGLNGFVSHSIGVRMTLRVTARK